MNKLVMFAVTVALFASACTKERKASFAYGTGENLLTVADYDGKSFVITTGKAVGTQKQNFSKAKDLSVNAKIMGGDSFSVVNYEVDTELAKTLLGNTPIVGRTNFKYAGLIRVTEHFVKIYKVGKEEDIPVTERTYGEKLSDGRLAIPLVGYPVTGLFAVDRARNELNEKTSTLTEKALPNMSGATNFRMDLTRGQIFEAVTKTDVLPASYFEGEWFYSEMVTSAQEEESTSLGMGGVYDSSMTPSSRVKFVSSEDTLKVVNLNIDERLTQKEDTNFKTTMDIPVEWKAYKTSENGQGLTEQEDSSIHWEKRRYVQLNLGNVRTLMTMQVSGRLVSLEVSDEYFSFTVQVKENNMRLKYAFMRVPKTNNYKAKRWFKEDKKSFGFFETEKSVAATFEINRLEDIEKNLYVSRFNPANGKIVYHFTKTTPAWIRPAVRNAFKVWDDAFKAAGTGMDVVLDESMDIELGDIRYNAVNIIETLTGSNLFGFGPSITDPKTGEIISATTNVHITPIRESIIEEIRAYIQLKTGVLKGSEISGISSHLKILNNMQVQENENGVSVISDAFPFAKKLKMYLPEGKAKFSAKYSLKNVDFRNRNSKKPMEFDVAMASGHIHEEIEDQCPEVTRYIQTLNSKKLTHNSSEVQVLNDCSKKLVVVKFGGTLIHEMGHNFGLRHNFTASNDSANFWSTKVTKTKHQVRSSSVMEYPSFNEDRLVMPGLYDVAAIRFGYADAIETKDGKILKLDTSKTIKNNLQQKNAEARTFKFCTDEDVALSYDPMCQRHDAGVTPLEIVKNTIAEYHKTYQLLNFRRDSIRSIDPMKLALYRMQRFLFPMKRFYEEWRLGISKYLGVDDQYLERLSAEEFNEVIKKMSKDPRYSQFVKDYEPTSKLIFGFFFNVMSMENRYCIYKDAKQNLNVVELAKLRDQVYSVTGKTTNSCADAIATGKSENMSPMAEVGYHFNDMKFDLSPQSAMELTDILGVSFERLFSLLSLTERDSFSYESYTRNFAPSMMDEPQFRNALKSYSMFRLQQGVSGQSLAALISKDSNVSGADKEVLKKMTFQRFTEEKDLVGILLGRLTEGSLIPGKISASLGRLESMRGFIATSMDSIDQNRIAAFTHIPGAGYYIVQSAANKDALQLLSTYDSINEMVNTKKFDVNDAENAALIKVLKEHLPSMSQMGSFTVKQALEMVQKMEVELKPYLDSAEKTAKVKFLISDLGQLMGLAQMMAEQDANVKEEDKQKQEEEKQKILEQSVNDIFEKAGMKYTLVKETVDSKIAENNGKLQRYLDNRAEYDAQLDLITAAMIKSANL